MSKQPKLRVILGSKEPHHSRPYRLPRGYASGSATAALEWPRAGAWRELVQRLLRNPIVPE